jgi:hypothetical protein
MLEAGSGELEGMPLFFIQVTTGDGRIEFGRPVGIAIAFQWPNQMSRCLLVKFRMEVLLACPRKMFPALSTF